MKIIKNFLPYEQFSALKNKMTSHLFNWTFVEGVTRYDDGHFQLVHTFYDEYSPKSEHVDDLVPIIDKIKPTSIVRIKANLLTKTNKICVHGEHTDFNIADNIEIGTIDKIHRSQTSLKGMVTAVYYINTCNGYTKIGKTKVNSEENKIVFFDANTPHSGTSCTDKNCRIVINFNFYP